jgi:flagellar biosynthesis protein FlhG
VIDADLGLANLDVVLNLYPKLTLHDVISGKAEIHECLIKTTGGFDVLLAGSGLVEYSRLTTGVRDDFLRIMGVLHPRFDVILLDTGAGISDVVLFAVSLASEVLLVATPEPTSLTDAYATIKVLSAQQKRECIRMVINQTIRLGDGRAITVQPQGVNLKLVHTGDIPSDPSVKTAIMRRQLLMLNTPGCPAALAISQLALKLDESVIGGTDAVRSGR